jgi:hypothetical protein
MTDIDATRMYPVFVRAPARWVDWQVPNKKWDSHLPANW